jgi:hypothetical protein
MIFLLAMMGSVGLFHSHYVFGILKNLASAKDEGVFI